MPGRSERSSLQARATGPSSSAAGRDFVEVTREICGLVDGPVSAEVVALDHPGMMREAEVLRKIADNVTIKVPLTIDGLKTCKALTSDGTLPWGLESAPLGRRSHARLERGVVDDAGGAQAEERVRRRSRTGPPRFSAPGGSPGRASGS